MCRGGPIPERTRKDSPHRARILLEQFAIPQDCCRIHTFSAGWPFTLRGPFRFEIIEWRSELRALNCRDLRPKPAPTTTTCFSANSSRRVMLRMQQPS